MAEKRVSEFVARTGKPFKSLIMITGDILSDLTLEHPLFPQRHIPVSIYNEVSSTFGTGINAVNPGHDLDSLNVAVVSIINNS